MATLQHALAVLADEGLIIVRQGRTAVVAGEAEPNGTRPGAAPAVIMTASGWMPAARVQADEAKTIRNIHSILSGAFATAKTLGVDRLEPS